MEMPADIFQIVNDFLSRHGSWGTRQQRAAISEFRSTGILNPLLCLKLRMLLYHHKQEDDIAMAYDWLSDALRQDA